MKKIKYLSMLCMFVELLIACSNQGKRIKDLWKVEDTVNYQNFTDDENKKIVKLLNAFSLEERIDKLNWNSGYSQQCYVLRKLYFERIIPRKVFLDSCASVYKRYEANQTNISFHTAGYAVCLYYLGERKQANELFIKILDKSAEKYFAPKRDYEIIVTVCSKLLGLANSNNLKTDEFLFNMTDDDIINIFCGN